MKLRPLVTSAFCFAATCAIVQSVHAQEKPSPPTPVVDASRGSAMRELLSGLGAKRVGGASDMDLGRLRAVARDAEEALREGRLDEAVAHLYEVVENAGFEPFADDEGGQACVFLLGDALASAGAFQAARAYLVRLLAMKSAWAHGEGAATVSSSVRRAVRRLVEIAMEREAFADGLKDLAAMPEDAGPEMRGEYNYLLGRSREQAGDVSGALGAYAKVAEKSRFWAQAVYLSGLLEVERGRMKEGENLFCRVADPNRPNKSAPFFADPHFFAVRDLARLALGRVAHEQARFDDARYYYYLVPRDSDRLAEALYEAATGRYEKKDYDGARTLLDELKELNLHHRYEDEVWILEAYLDLAQCKFPDADRRLQGFVRRYEPLRAAVRQLGADPRGVRSLILAARVGADAGGTEILAGKGNVDSLRTIAALLRVDPSLGVLERQRSLLERELTLVDPTARKLQELGRALATLGGVQATLAESTLDQKRADAENAILGLRKEMADLGAGGATDLVLGPMRKELLEIESRLRGTPTASVALELDGDAIAGRDLGAILRADEKRSLGSRAYLERAIAEVSKAEETIGADALRRLDLRLSRLLRRARFARVESMLGTKRALEVEVEALSQGFLPASALDSLDAARTLEDNEEYWPFEGDDWPDEFVGSEQRETVKPKAASHPHLGPK